jgi:hypothetical protein
MTVPPARRFAVRARHAIAFVVIVWGVAATFVAFEIVALSGMDIVLSYPRIFGDIALSRSVTQSVACAPRPGETSGMPSAAGGRRDAGAGAWLLGVSLGRDAVVRQLAGVSPASVAQMAAGRSDLASRLGVPPPAVFGPQQMATANTEFIAFVEHDASDTAHRLAVSSSPRACELFKLGAFWGYSEMVRPALPGQRAAFALEIRYHALRAGVPEALWSPMLQRSPANDRPDQIAAQTGPLTDAITAYLR